MLMYLAARNRNPNRFLCNSTYLSLSTFQSSPNPNNRSAPRKGRQAVRRILKLLSSSPSSRIENPNLSETLKVLDSSPESLSPSQASDLITKISNPLISFDFYRYLRSSRPFFKSDSILFATLIKSQLQSINPFLPKIQYFFTEMKKQNVSLSSNDLNSLFDLVVPDHPEIAEFLISEVLEKNEFDESCFNHVISVYAKHGMCKEAILISNKSKMRQKNPSLGFYSSLMDVYRVNGDSKAAMKLFLEMEEKGVLADEEIYRVLLSILYKARRVKLCWVIMEEMMRVGYKPNVSLCRNLITLLMKEDMVSEVESLFRKGYVDDEESLGIFVETLIEKGKLLVALELIKNMQVSGFNVDGYVFASLIRGCGKIGLIDDAENIFAKIKTSEIVKKKEMVYSSMLYIYSKAETKEMAELIFNEMQTTEGFKVSGSEFLYMMSMYGNLGLVNDVVKMFDSWKTSGCSLSIDAYVILVDALSKSGKLNQARGFLLEMRSFGIHPSNSIYSSMIEGYMRVGLLNHAIALFDEYKLSGLEVDEVIVESIIKILIQTNRYLELGVYLDKFTKQMMKIPRDKGALFV